ncbi:hypothetical protein H4Q26_017191 [Puccinia striiformis f. sp. tritici PST-130]|nr:hypothetical protein H4Q26_017191 [Puccinia striiformis f. sp. tritici PST-130]
MIDSKQQQQQPASTVPSVTTVTSKAKAVGYRARLRTISLFLLTTIILLLLTSILLTQSTHHQTISQDIRQEEHQHDYDKFVWHKDILSDWDPNSDHRLIALGDIHGMVDSLKELLEKLNYDPKSDTVLLVGDLAAKHPKIQASLDTIRYARESNFEAVRGNHDEYIIIWRNWMEVNRNKFVTSDHLSLYEADEFATLQTDQWLQASQPLIISRINYLMEWIGVSTLRNRSTYFVHAGMLPWVPPTEPEGDKAREVMTLLGVKENKDPYTLLEMRGLKKGRRRPRTLPRVNRGSSARAWCQRTQYVVYGHWAGKGLTLKPWSIGLDQDAFMAATFRSRRRSTSPTVKKSHHLHHPIPIKLTIITLLSSH